MKDGNLKSKFFFTLFFFFTLNFSLVAEEIQVVPLINLDEIKPSYDDLGEFSIDSESKKEQVTGETGIGEKIPKTVSLSVLNKITAQVDILDLRLKANFVHGELKLYPIDCYLSKADEKYEVAVYLNVHHKSTNKKIFAGWMLKTLPSISAIEHPVYDLWVNDWF